MVRPVIKPQSPHHIYIFDEDWQWIEEHYGPKSESKIGISQFIRSLVHKFVSNMRDREVTEIDRKKERAL